MTDEAGTMRAFRVPAIGQPPTVCRIAVPTPAKGEVQVRIRAAGVNFSDQLMAQGQYQEKIAPPFTLGMECAGEITRAGPGVADLEPGQRVAVYAGHGGYAEYGCFAAERCLPIPDTVDFDTAAAFQIAYGTSHLALDYRAKLQPGETLLVTGAAGGVGLTAVEIGKRLGARVVAAARGAGKCAAAQAAGADHVIDTDAQDLREAMIALGRADVVYETVGGDSFSAALRSVRPEGRILAIGFASGTVPQINAAHLLVKNVSVIGFYWGGYLNFAPDILQDSLRTLLGWIEDGSLSPHISHRLPLDQAPEAMRLLRTREATGKVVVQLD